MTVTVFSQPQCVQCNATYRGLDAKGIQYEVVELSENPDRLEEVKALGYMRAPVVIAGDEHWSGYRPDKINELAEKVAAAA